MLTNTKLLTRFFQHFMLLVVRYSNPEVGLPLKVIEEKSLGLKSQG